MERENCKQNQKHRRGSNAGNEKGKKSKRSKKSKLKKKLSLDGTGGENDSTPAELIARLSFNDTGADSDSSRHVATNKLSVLKKISSSTSASSGLEDILSKEHLSLMNDNNVNRGKRSPLWLTDTVVKEHFLKMADQASDFDESVWKSVKLTMCQKAYKSLSAKYKNKYTSAIPRFEDSCSALEAESLRWDFMVEDTSEEMERLRVYKINRRKRFLADRHAKGLELTHSNLNNQSDVLQQTMSTTYLDIDDGPALSQIFNPLGLGADDSREMVLNCS